MPGVKSDTILLRPGWTLSLPLFALGSLLLSSPERRLWTAPLAATVFALLQWVLPRCRFRKDHYFGPVNIALTLFSIKLVLTPALIMLGGAQAKVLTYIPGNISLQGALWIDVFAYAAFCVGLSLSVSPGGNEAKPLAALAGQGPSAGVVALFACLGIAGFLAAFGNPANLVAYFLDPTPQIEQEPEAGMVALAGTFLRPFMAFAFAAWWTRQVDSADTRWRLLRIACGGLIVAAGVTLANLTFSFNRAAFVFPLVSMIAVYSARVKRIPAGVTLVAALAMLPVLIVVETVRSNRMSGAQTHSATLLDRAVSDLSENIQGYGGAPQYSAIFLEKLDWGEHLFGGSTLVASVMTPVPVLGKSFRETSGPALFNRAIYDVRDIEDQIIPLATELFVNFHLLGVVVGFALFGLMAAKAQEWFRLADSAFAAFSIQYMAMWAAMMAAWSLSVFSQIAIYFFGPVYFYVAIRRFLGWLASSSRRPSVAFNAETLA